MSKKRNPMHLVKHRSWASNVHESDKAYDRQRDKHVDIEDYEGLVWDTVNGRHALLDTALEIIIDSELEDSPNTVAYEDMEEIILNDIDFYLEAHGYRRLEY